jgi:hemerythrin
MDMEKTSDVLWQDTQHQVLFSLLEEIAEPNSERLVLEKLSFYAENHFALEEAYMSSLQYPGEEEHRRAHDKFRQELGQMLNPEANHDLASRQIISTFLTEWLKRHIFGIDKQLEAFLLNSGVN